MSGAPHHQPKLEISVWLDREALRYGQKETRDTARAERLRADLVKARMGKAAKV